MDPKSSAPHKSPEPKGHEGNRYDHYLKIVKILEKLKREDDLVYGQRLVERLVEAHKNGALTQEQVKELSNRINQWARRMEARFASEDYQLQKLMKAFAGDERRKKKV